MLLLGYAGLLPQAIALAGVIWGGPDWTAHAMAAALAYGALILSFLGGIWWAFSARRPRQQAGLAVVAVLPSLVAFALTLAVSQALNAGVSSERCYLAGSIGFGLALALTLPVDWHLERRGDAPPGWTRFRAVLSLGLAVLTICAGIQYYRWTETVTFI